MLVNDVKPIGKVGKNLLQNKNADEIIETIIEKPLQKACKKCKNKNIETVMSSANKNNIMENNKKTVTKKDVIEMLKNNKTPTFLEAGKGYAWIMLNYDNLSSENKEKLFTLESVLGEDAIWFVKSNYIEFKNSIRKFFKKKEIVEFFDDEFAEKFNEKKLTLMYNHKYPLRSVFIRMPIDEKTTIEDVESYFDTIIDNFIKQ